MRLTYWIAACLNDSSVYSIRAATKREVVAIIDSDYNPSNYGKPTKVTVEYTSGLDLLQQCMCEGNGYWENPAYKDGRG